MESEWNFSNEMDWLAISGKNWGAGLGEIFVVRMFSIFGLQNNKIIENWKPVVCDERIIGIPHQTANILTMKRWNFTFVILGFVEIKDDLELEINQNIFTKGFYEK